MQERQIRSREVWGALGGSRGRAFHLHVCVGCHFVATGAPSQNPCLSTGVKDIVHFLCPGDGLMA